MIHITAIPAFSDNYIWCLSDESKNAIIIDPGCARSVEHFLSENNLKLHAILITHHHPDHIGGVKKLKEKYSPKIFGFKGAAFDFLDYKLINNQTFSLLDIEFKTIEVPGHTLDHIAFYTVVPVFDKATDSEGVSNGMMTLQPSLFCGDTLFSAGCGRLFEGTAEQMFDSLNILSSLPKNTLVYCAHEYTLSNLAFAKTLMPCNQDLLTYIKECEDKRQKNLPTIPATLSTELKINPFLRYEDPEIYSSLAKQGLIKEHSHLEVFRAVRKAKDSF